MTSNFHAFPHPASVSVTQRTEGKCERIHTSFFGHGKERQNSVREMEKPRKIWTFWNLRVDIIRRTSPNLAACSKSSSVLLGIPRNGTIL